MAPAPGRMFCAHLRSLYLAWLSAYGGWDRDEDAFGGYGEDVFGGDDEDAVEPPVPAGLGSLTAPQRALADFLRVYPDLLAAAQASLELPSRAHQAGAARTCQSVLMAEERLEGGNIGGAVRAGDTVRRA